MSQVFAPDMVACVMQLQASQLTQLEQTQGHRAHALFLNIISHSDPALAERLHEPRPIKPWTVAPLQFGKHDLRPGSAYEIRVCFLDADLYQPFAKTFIYHAPPPLQLGHTTLTLREISTTNHHPWAGTTSWHELIGRAQPAETLTLHFVTPTAFALGSNARGQKRIGLFPDGPMIFQSLLKRWNHFAPAPMPEDLLEDVDILPSRYELHTTMLHFAKSKQVGFAGTITYTIEASETQRHLLAALADAAFYLGVGYKTTQGMGLVRRLP